MHSEIGSYIVCIPDTQDSQEFLRAAEKYTLPLLLLVKESWMKSVKNYTWDSLLVEDFNQKENIRNLIQSYLSKHNAKLFTCIAFGEGNIELIGYLNTTFRIEGLNHVQAILFRDKYEMKQKAQDLGLPVPLFSTCYDRKRLYQQLTKENKTFKILIKPKKAWGCQGIVAFDSQDEVERYLKHLKNWDDYLLEEYLVAEMYHVGGLINQGETIHSVVVKHGASLFEMGRSSPEHLILHTIDQQSTEAKELKKYHDRIVKEFGLTYGLTFIEFFRETSTGKILLCEAAARHPALHVPKLYEIVAGFNYFEAYAELLSCWIQRKNYCLSIPKMCNPYAGIISFAALPGKLTYVDSLERFNEEEIVYKNQPADLINKHFETISFKNTIGQIIIQTESEKRCLDLLREYCTNFKYQTVAQ
jgi:hypothetical protein